MSVVELIQRKRIKKFLKDSQYEATEDIQKRKRGHHQTLGIDKGIRTKRTIH